MTEKIQKQRTLEWVGEQRGIDPQTRVPLDNFLESSGPSKVLDKFKIAFEQAREIREAPNLDHYQTISDEKKFHLKRLKTERSALETFVIKLGEHLANVREPSEDALKLMREQKIVLEQLEHQISDATTALTVAQNFEQKTSELLKQKQKIRNRRPKIFGLISLPEFVVPIPEPVVPIPEGALPKVQEQVDSLDTWLKELQTPAIATRQMLGYLSEEQQKQVIVFGDEPAVRRALFQKQQCALLKQKLSDLENRKKVLESNAHDLEKEIVKILNRLGKVPEIDKTAFERNILLKPPGTQEELETLADTLPKQDALMRINEFSDTYQKTANINLPYEALRQYEIDLKTLGLLEHAKTIADLADRLQKYLFEQDLQIQYEVKIEKREQLERESQKIQNQIELAQNVTNLLERMEEVTWFQAANNQLRQLNIKIKQQKPLLDKLKELSKLDEEDQQKVIAKTDTKSLNIPLTLKRREAKFNELWPRVQNLQQKANILSALSKHHLGLIRQFDLERRPMPSDPFIHQLARTLYRDLGPTVSVSESDMVKALSEIGSGLQESMPNIVTTVFTKLKERLPNVGIVKEKIQQAWSQVTMAPGRELLADLVRDGIMASRGVDLEKCKTAFKEKVRNIAAYLRGDLRTKTSLTEILSGLLSWLYNNPQAAQDLSADLQAMFQALQTLQLDSPVDKLLASVRGKAMSASLGVAGVLNEDTELSDAALGLLEYSRLAPYVLAATATPGSTVLGSLFSFQPHGLIPSAGMSVLARVGDFLQNTTVIAASKVIAKNVANEHLPLVNALVQLREGKSYKDVIQQFGSNLVIGKVRRIWDSLRHNIKKWKDKSSQSVGRVKTIANVFSGLGETIVELATFKDTRRLWKHAGFVEKICRGVTDTLSTAGSVMIAAGAGVAIAGVGSVFGAPLGLASGGILAGIGFSLLSLGFLAGAYLDGSFSKSRVDAAHEEALKLNQEMNILKKVTYQQYLQEFCQMPKT